jgi:hypothetical protein
MTSFRNVFDFFAGQRKICVVIVTTENNPRINNRTHCYSYILLYIGWFLRDFFFQRHDTTSDAQ